MSETLSQSAALRLGLACKAMPDIATQALVQLVTDELGIPLSEKRLRSLTPKRFRQLLTDADCFPEESAQFTQAHLILTGDTISEMKAPSVPEPVELSGPFLRIAITSNNEQQIDGHFGSCLRVLVYEVCADGTQLVEVRPVAFQGKGDQRTSYMLTLIEDCHILVTQSIGGPAAARVVNAHIHPMKQVETMTAPEYLLRLQGVLAGSPPPWIRVLLDKQA